MHDTDFRQGEFLRANLSRTNMRSCELTGVLFSLGILDGAHLNDSGARGAVFFGASLVGADLSNVFVTDADFTEADLRNAILTGVNLADSVIDDTIF